VPRSAGAWRGVPESRQLQIKPAYAEAPSALQALPMSLRVAEFPKRLPKHFPHGEFGMSDQDRPILLKNY